MPKAADTQHHSDPSRKPNCTPLQGAFARLQQTGVNSNSSNTTSLRCEESTEPHGLSHVDVPRLQLQGSDHDVM
jgi:hypothetical protein